MLNFETLWNIFDVLGFEKRKFALYIVSVCLTTSHGTCYDEYNSFFTLIVFDECSATLKLKFIFAGEIIYQGNSNLHFAKIKNNERKSKKLYE